MRRTGRCNHLPLIYDRTPLFPLVFSYPIHWERAPATIRQTCAGYSSAPARVALRSRELFNRKGELKNIRKLKFWPLQDVLFSKCARPIQPTRTRADGKVTRTVARAAVLTAGFKRSSYLRGPPLGCVGSVLRGTAGY